MTRKRLFVIAGIFVSVVCIVLATLAMLPSRPGVTKANFDRIEKGMTRPEVESIFGRKESKGFWRADNGACAFVNFNLSGHAVDMGWWDSEETTWEKMLRWLHLRKD